MSSGPQEPLQGGGGLPYGPYPAPSRTISSAPLPWARARPRGVLGRDSCQPWGRGPFRGFGAPATQS